MRSSPAMCVTLLSNPPLVEAPARSAQGKRQVVPGGHVRIERVLLEDEREVAGGRRLAGHVAAADPDMALVRLLQPRDEAERGGLAGPGRAEQHQELAVRDVEIHPFDGGHVAEALADAQQRDISHGRSPGRGVRGRSRHGFPPSRE